MTSGTAEDLAVETPELLRALATGGGVLTGIPCSHLGGIFETAQRTDGWRMVPPATEGEAVGIACGVIAMGGAAVVAMQNSGLGSALDPLVSLAAPGRITVPLVVSHRGHPEVEQLAQHVVMGRITLELLSLAGVRSIALRRNSIADVRALAAAATEARESFAIVVRRGDLRSTSAPVPLTLGTAIRVGAEVMPARAAATVGSPALPGRGAVLVALQLVRPVDTIVVATTGHTSRQLYSLADDERNVYLSGSMGYASAFALGANLQRPDLNTVVLDGDGSALMHLGSLTTIGGFGGSRFRHVVLDNGVHGSTGGQPTVAPSVDFPALAAAAGYRSTATCSDAGSVPDAVRWLLAATGPALLHIRTAAEPGAGLPRIGIGLDDQLARLSSWAAGWPA